MSKTAKAWYPRPGINERNKLAIDLLPKVQRVYPDITLFTLNTLVLRGFDSVDKIVDFFKFNEENIALFTDYQDGKKAVERIVKAIKGGEEITILGDYDNDGVMATVTMLRGLQMLGVKANFYINNRFVEGYGIKPESIDAIYNKYPSTKLIVTVDNGIVGFAGVDRATELGIDVVVTDHHEPSANGEIPNCCAVVDPKRHGETVSFTEICGAAVAYKLILALNKELNNDANLDSFKLLMGFVASATVSDVMPLVDENRFFVRQGMVIASSNKFQCFKQLRLANNIKRVVSDTFGFYYGPIVNAVGRLTGGVEKAVEFFLEENEELSSTKLKELIKLNDERKELQKVNIQMAENLYQLDGMQDDKVLIFFDEFHEGLAGIVAGQMCERYKKPTIVLAPTHNDKTVYKGSARSLDGYNMKKALDRCADFTIGHGGHELAAGLSVKLSDIKSLTKAMSDLCSEEEFDYKIPDKIFVDYVMSEKEITAGLTKDIEGRLEPFGMGFEKPTVLLKGVKIDGNKDDIDAGNAKDHLIVKSEAGLTIRKWNFKNKFLKDIYKDDATYNGLGFPIFDTFGRNSRVVFDLEDIKTA